MRLDHYTTEGFRRGHPASWVEAIWVFVQPVSLSSPWLGSRWRVSLLRLFGVRIGRGVTIKARVRVRFPWRLEIGDYSWIGEHVWLDSRAKIHIGDYCCLSVPVR
jgi:putative colanic acid biosynthesis acetyltransferase WcaF